MGNLARGSDKTPQIAESTSEQTLDEPQANKTRGPRYQNRILGIDDKVAVFH
jgi:hypothetical protein